MAQEGGKQQNTAYGVFVQVSLFDFNVVSCYGQQGYQLQPKTVT